MAITIAFCRMPRPSTNAAKATWTSETIGTIQPPGDGRPVTPKTVRNAIRLLTGGPSARKEVKIIQLYKDRSVGSGSEECTTPEENREVMVESLRKTFSQVGTFDPAAVAKVRQRPQQSWMDRAPSAAGIPAARSKLGAGKSGGHAEFPGEFW